MLFVADVSETFWMNATLLDDIHASSEMVAYSWVCLMPGIQPPTTAHNIHRQYNHIPSFLETLIFLLFDTIDTACNS